MSVNSHIGARKTPPNEQLTFKIIPTTASWQFVPEFYPEDFTDVKEREMERHGSGCEGESVSIKKVKNIDIHISGKVLRGELPVLRALQSYDKEVDVISPLFDDGGIRCYIKRLERGNEAGWDPVTGQRYFEYDMDILSSGVDEGDGDGRNGIVSEIILSTET